MVIARAIILLVINCVSLQQKVKLKLDFVAPTILGSKPIHFMCNACLECDQEYEFTIDVKKAVDDAEDGKSMDE